MHEYEPDQWQKVWIDPESLGVDPSVDATA